MAYSLESMGGRVEFRMRTGKDMVLNTMPLFEAERLLQNAATAEIVGDGNTVCVNDLYFFPVVPEKKNKKRRKNEE